MRVQIWDFNIKTDQIEPYWCETIDLTSFEQLKGEIQNISTKLQGIEMEIRIKVKEYEFYIKKDQQIQMVNNRSYNPSIQNISLDEIALLENPSKLKEKKIDDIVKKIFSEGIGLFVYIQYFYQFFFIALVNILILIIFGFKRESDLNTVFILLGISITALAYNIWAIFGFLIKPIRKNNLENLIPYEEYFQTIDFSSYLITAGQFVYFLFYIIWDYFELENQNEKIILIIIIIIAIGIMLVPELIKSYKEYIQIATLKTNIMQSLLEKIYNNTGADRVFYMQIYSRVDAKSVIHVGFLPKLINSLVLILPYFLNILQNYQ